MHWCRVAENTTRRRTLSLWSVSIALAAAACSDDGTASKTDEAGRWEGGGPVQLGDGGDDPDGDAATDEPDASAGAGARDADTGAAGDGSANDATDAGEDGAAGGGGASGGGAEDGGGGMGGMGGGAAGEPAPTTCYDKYPGVLICDDFEDADLAGWTRHSSGSDGHTVHTTALAYRGTGALDSTKLSPGDSDPVYRDALGKRTSGHVYLRGYLRVPSGFAIKPAGSRASLLVLGEDTGALGGLSLVMWQNEVSLQVNGKVMSDIKAVHALPRDAWMCVQIDFDIATAGAVRLRIDGRTIFTGTRNTLMTTHYERLWLGVNWIAPEQTDDVRVLYDDVFVGTQDIACD
jgi:hypothetical protein